MQSHKWTLASALTILFAMQSTGSNAEPRIGTAASTRPNVEAISGGNTQTLSAGSEIYANQTVRTGNHGKADLVFIDKTNLSVGPASEVRLGKFAYDPKGSAGSVVMQATRGTVTFVTGSQAHEAYQISTPHGALVVHGTTVEILVNQRDVNKPGEVCATKLRLVEGQAEYKIAKTGKVARLNDPNRNNCACITPGGDVTYSTGCPPLLASDEEVPPIPPPPAAGPITPPPPTSPTKL
jgi:FecR-like protein